jgi:hypothetical protein
MNKHYAVSDLHGIYDLWKQIRDYCDDTDTIYFLGDAADRGPDGIKIIKELLSDSRVIYLQGNHEEFIAWQDISLWMYNGGKNTIDDFNKLSPEKQDNITIAISDLPIKKTYINTKGQEIILTHSGYCENQGQGYAPWNYYLQGKQNPYLWDRSHIYEGWNFDNNTYIVHGHTPVSYLGNELNYINRITHNPIINYGTEVINYCEGHKFDIDMCSFRTGVTALFDLDELKVEKYFYTYNKN